MREGKDEVGGGDEGKQTETSLFGTRLLYANRVKVGQTT